MPSNTVRNRTYYSVYGLIYSEMWHTMCQTHTCIWFHQTIDVWHCPLFPCCALSKFVWYWKRINSIVFCIQTPHLSAFLSAVASFPDPNSIPNGVNATANFKLITLIKCHILSTVTLAVHVLVLLMLFFSQQQQRPLCYCYTNRIQWNWVFSVCVCAKVVWKIS